MKNARLLLAGIALAACDTPAPELESSSHAATAQSDLRLDGQTLNDTVRFESRQNVQPGEVLDGCAAGQSDRALLRFDLRVENVGTKDIDFGEISCISTNPAPECFGRTCRDYPSCCCSDQSLCTPESGAQSDFFTFSCGHRDVNLRSAASYKLFNKSGTVVKKRLQGILLRDRENLAGDGDCKSKNLVEFGELGLHAGCATEQPSVVGCQYLDVTGVSPGSYNLEVKIDALNAVSESDENNNAVTVPVTIGESEPVLERTRPVYLVCYGDGTPEEGIAYYQGLAPGGFDAGKLTLDDWTAQFMGNRPQIDTIYRNANELSFWREMHCTKTIGRDDGGCWVRNWAKLKDFNAGTPNLGTVAMRIDDQGITQFFVFGPDGKLSPQAVLDDEGAKSVPRLCVNCHGGSYDGTTVDLGSSFREFEPSLLELRPGLTQAKADVEFFTLNQAVRSANLAVRSEAEGAPLGTDAAKEAMDRYIDNMYEGTDPQAANVRDPVHVPPSWKNGHSAKQARLNVKLWEFVVAPYCMSCHRNNLINWEDYDIFSTLGPPAGALRDLIAENPDDPDRTNQIFMPQSKLAWSNLVNDAEAMIAIQRWLDNDETGSFVSPTPGSDAFVNDPHARLFAPSVPPVVLVDHPAEAQPRQVVTLSARQSFDPDGHRIATRWEQIFGPEVTVFPGADEADARFVTPPVIVPTTVGFRLVVSDSGGAVTERYVDVLVSP